MNKIKTFYDDSIYDLETQIMKFAEEHNVISIAFYTGESNFVKKRAMVIYNDNESKR